VPVVCLDEPAAARTVAPMRSSSHIGLRVAGGYVAGTGLGAAALATLPTTPTGGIAPVDALFTAASAVTLTGMSVVDTATLTGVGQAVVFILIAFGALGVAAATIGLVVLLGRGGWSARQSVAADISASGSEQRPFLLYVAASVVAATVLGGGALRLAGLDWWDAFFHALSGFANAGFSTRSDSLASVSTAAVGVVSLLVVAGGLGYPVTFELLRRLRRRSTAPLSSTTYLTVLTSAVLLAVGAVVFALLEWTRPETVGSLSLPRRVAAVVALTVMPRSAGFNLTDTGELSDGSLLTTIALMFIGAGPAATAGGIKTTGFAVLVIATVAALRGREHAHAGRFGIEPRLVNHVVAVTASLAATVFVVAVVLAGSSGLTAALFNATSAVTTTGLSIGDSHDDVVGKLALTAGMLVGRLAPMLLAVRLMEHRRALVRPANRAILVT